MIEVRTVRLATAILLATFSIPCSAAEVDGKYGCWDIAIASEGDEQIPDDKIEEAFENCRLEERRTCEALKSKLEIERHSLAARLQCGGVQSTDTQQNEQVDQNGCWELPIYAESNSAPKARVDEAIETCKHDKRENCRLTVAALKEMGSKIADRLSCDGPE